MTGSPMRFLADECCDFAMVKALRKAGHDVVTVREELPGADDGDVADLALREGRVLLTEDKDFGQLVFAHGQGTLGVIFLRYPFQVRLGIAGELVKLVERIGQGLFGSFATVQPGKIRVNRMPKG